MSNLEYFIDFSPHRLKKAYVTLTQVLKRFLTRLGIINWLDDKSQHSKRYHYIRSLFAIHQLDDMVQLDTPWWTYPAIEFVNDYLSTHPQQACIFEYGSGASTIWLAKRAQSVISIEHDPTWHAQLNKHLEYHQNVMLLLTPPVPSRINEVVEYQSMKSPNLNFKDYVKSINQFNRLFDLIIVDGRARDACVNEALNKLKPNGFIVLDNSNRKRYQTVLNRDDITMTRYRGRVPGSPFKSETAIIFKKTKLTLTI